MKEEEKRWEDSEERTQRLRSLGRFLFLNFKNYILIT
jgi:hypothetical protein